MDNRSKNSLQIFVEIWQDQLDPILNTIKVGESGNEELRQNYGQQKNVPYTKQWEASLS